MTYANRARRAIGWVAFAALLALVLVVFTGAMVSAADTWRYEQSPQGGFRTDQAWSVPAPAGHTCEVWVASGNVDQPSIHEGNRLVLVNDGAEVLSLDVEQGEGEVSAGPVTVEVGTMVLALVLGPDNRSSAWYSVSGLCAEPTTTTAATTTTTAATTTTVAMTTTTWLDPCERSDCPDGTTTTTTTTTEAPPVATTTTTTEAPPVATTTVPRPTGVPTGEPTVGTSMGTKVGSAAVVLAGMVLIGLGVRRLWLDR